MLSGFVLPVCCFVCSRSHPTVGPLLPGYGPFLGKPFAQKSIRSLGIWLLRELPFEIYTYIEANTRSSIQWLGRYFFSGCYNWHQSNHRSLKSGFERLLLHLNCHCCRITCDNRRTDILWAVHATAKVALWSHLTEAHPAPSEEAHVSAQSLVRSLSTVVCFHTMFSGADLSRLEADLTSIRLIAFCSPNPVLLDLLMVSCQAFAQSFFGKRCQ